MIALLLGRFKHLSVTDGMEIVTGLERLPAQITTVLKQADSIRAIAARYARYDNFFFIGRKYNYPMALEGALKLKEISYIHAEGYPAGEMKHGPNALIDRNLPVVTLAARDPNNPKSVLRYEKMVSNIEEVRAREGIIVALASEDDDQLPDITRHIIRIPEASDYLLPVLMIVPLQLLAYHIAVLRGCDVDQPRNLAKSVTVE